MELDITWAGPPIDDLQLLSKLPDDLTKLLKSVNGFIQFSGALHVRGACQNLEWHSLRHAWESTDAFHRHYRTVKRSDVPFAQSALGDQYFIRDNDVYRLDTECDEIESLDMDFKTFLEEVQSDPIGALNLEPLEEFWDQGGALEPGHLLSVMPPFFWHSRIRSTRIEPSARWIGCVFWPTLPGKFVTYQTVPLFLST